jgi:hypothetical protein
VKTLTLIYILNNVYLFVADHFTAKLSVRMTSGPDFVTTNFTFFDCNTYSSCTQCVSSLFPCDWCVDGHRCTHDTAENCRNDILVTGVSVSSLQFFFKEVKLGKVNLYFVHMCTHTRAHTHTHAFHGSISL